MTEYSDFENDEDRADYVHMANSIISKQQALHGGRLLRLAVVQSQFNDGNLTEEEARELLCGNLTPTDDSTFLDDSDQLETNMKVVRGVGEIV